MNGIKQFLPLFIVIVLLLPVSCSQLGKQPPEWENGAFTPDGKHYVYLYSIFNVTQYSQGGGATYRSGTTRYYLQIIDPYTGEKLLKNPISFKDMVRIGDISNDYVWLGTRDREKQKNSIAIVDIASGQLKYSHRDMIRQNPDVPFGYGTFYRQTSGLNEAVYEADDGRKYLVNPTNGIMTVLHGQSGPRIDLLGDEGYQFEYSMDGLQRLNENGSRIRFAIAGTDTTITSTDDFLNPQFLAVDKQSTADDAVPTVYHDSFFILSSKLQNNSNEMIFTRVNQHTLATVWATTLQETITGESPVSGNKYRLRLNGQTLFAANQSRLMAINLETGAVTATYQLF